MLLDLMGKAHCPSAGNARFVNLAVSPVTYQASLRLPHRSPRRRLIRGELQKVSTFGCSAGHSTPTGAALGIHECVIYITELMRLAD
jgi:hypothetical protein